MTAKKKKDKVTSVNLTAADREILAKLQEKYGQNVTNVVRLAIRELLNHGSQS